MALSLSLEGLCEETASGWDDGCAQAHMSEVFDLLDVQSQNRIRQGRAGRLIPHATIIHLYDISVHIYIYICICIHVYMYVYIYIYVYVYIYIHVLDCGWLWRKMYCPCVHKCVCFYWSGDGLWGMIESDWVTIDGWGNEELQCAHGHTSTSTFKGLSFCIMYGGILKLLAPSHQPFIDI